MVSGQNTYIIQFDKDIGWIIDFLSHVKHPSGLFELIKGNIRKYNNIKNKKYHTISIVSKSTRKNIIYRGKNVLRSRFCLCTDT